MEIKLNGETREVDAETTIARLLEQLGIQPNNLAVEHNGEFLEEDALEHTMVRAGDRLEVVRFVGGG